MVLIQKTFGAAVCVATGNTQRAALVWFATCDGAQEIEADIIKL